MPKKKRKKCKKRVKIPARNIKIPRYSRTSVKGKKHMVSKHNRHLTSRMGVPTVILPANESTSPLSPQETAAKKYTKRHDITVDVSKETGKAAAVIQKDRRERKRIVTARDLNSTLSEVVYPEDVMFQDINAAGRVYGIIATPRNIGAVDKSEINLERKFDDAGKPRGFDRTPSRLMKRDTKGRVRQIDMSLVATDKDIGLAPAFDSEFALSNFKDDREEFTQLLSVYMHWMDKNNRNVKQAVRTHSNRGGWNKNIGATKLRGKNVVFLTAPNNKELEGAAFQLPITHFALVKKVQGENIVYRNQIIPKYDIDRESEAGDTFNVAGQEVKYGAVFSNIGGLDNTAENRQYFFDYKYRYPTVFTKFHPETIDQIQEGSRRVSKRDRGKNTKRYQAARRNWAVSTQNAIKQASPSKKAELDKIKQLHVDPAYWEDSDYRIIKGVLGAEFVTKYGITRPPKREAYGLTEYKGGHTITEPKEPVTILFRRGRYNRRTGRHNADQVIIVQKVKPKDIYISPFTRKNPKGHGPRVPVKGHKRVLNKKKKSSTIIDLDERERKRRRRKLYNQRRKNRSSTKKTTKRR